MAIEQKGTATEHGITFGYSDFFSAIYTDGDLKVSELVKYSWAAAEEPNLNAQGTTNLNMANSQGVAAAVQISYVQRGLEQPDYDYKFKYVNNRLPTSKPYSFTILVYAPNDDNITFAITSDNGNKFRLVTDIDVQKLYIRVREVRTATLTYQLPTAGTITQYQQYCYSKLYSNIDDGAMKIYAMNVFVIDEDTFFITNCAGSPAFPPYAEGYSTGGGLYCRTKTFVPSRQQSYTTMTVQEETDSISNYQKSLWFLRWAGNEISDFLSETQSIRNSYNYYRYSDDIGLEFYCFDWDTVRWNMFMQTETSIYRILALNGLKCKFDTGDHQNDILRPVIIDKLITGYTFDPDAETEFDDITNVTGNSISPTPPGPVPPGGDDEDNDDPVSTVGAPFGTGLAHYYISTVDGAALTQISEAMSTWNIDTTKKDLYRNLISCKIVKPPTAVPATPGVFEIYGVKPQYQGADITINEVTGNPDISFGPYSIDRKFGDFRDRAPYSKVEIFLPYCGWAALPAHVIGRSVSVAYYSDIIAGTVKAVVFCGTNPVAEASGVMSVDIPFAAQNVGEKVAAANIGMLAYGKAGIQTAAGIGTAIASKGKSGWSNILSGGTALIGAYNQLAQVENGNYTEICGKSGDGCALAGVDTIVIKITRPLYGGNTEAPYVPAGFAHTVGFVSMKQSKVNACTGLIVCDNVEVSGISGATDAERAEIKRVLETGLYVNSPPE